MDSLATSRLKYIASIAPETFVDSFAPLVRLWGLPYYVFSLEQEGRLDVDTMNQVFVGLYHQRHPDKRLAYDVATLMHQATIEYEGLRTVQVLLEVQEFESPFEAQEQSSLESEPSPE